MAGKLDTRGRDRALVAFAGRQHGVITRTQARTVGLSDHEIDGRIARGWLRPIHRGVYAVGRPALAREGVWIAAALALGTRGAVSHRSAAQLWELMPGCSSPVHVTVPTPGGRARRNGIAVHRSALADETTVKRHIPVTVPERTLIDLAGQTDRRALERASDEAIRLRLTTEAKLQRAIGQRPNAARLGLILRGYEPGSTGTQNDFEELLLAISDQHDIPRPTCQRRAGAFLPDFTWPEHRLIVETDGYATHGTRKAFERDRRRDVELRAAGWTVLRFTWLQLTQEPGWVAAAMRSVLDLQQEQHVHHEERGERDGPAGEVALHQRAAADRSGAHAEGAGQARVLARVQQHEDDHDDREHDLKAAENGFHEAEPSGGAQPGRWPGEHRSLGPRY